MASITVGQKVWYSRVLAILYAWTLGLVIGVVFISLGLIYALLGTALKLLGIGSHRDLPFRRPILGTFEWWFGIHDHAISGTGVYDLFPPILD